jgi:hypothetical protein
MTSAARNAREAKRLAKVDAAAKEAGQYPLPEPERRRRCQALLNEEMARMRAGRAAKTKGAKS